MVQPTTAVDTPKEQQTMNLIKKTIILIANLAILLMLIATVAYILLFASNTALALIAIVIGIGSAISMVKKP